MDLIIYVELIKYIVWQILTSHKKIEKCLVIFIYMHLWLWAAKYDYIKIVSIWLHCNDLIHSVHKEITLQKLFTQQLFTATHAWSHKYNALNASNTRCTHKQNSLSSHSSQLVDRSKSRRLLLLPWCMAIAGYHLSSDNSNS